MILWTFKLAQGIVCRWIHIVSSQVYNQGSYGSWHSTFVAQLVLKCRATLADFVISLHSKHGEAKMNTPSNLPYEKYSIKFLSFLFYYRHQCHQ